MKYAFFQGCNIPVRIPQYAKSTEAVFNLFGHYLQIVDEFNCCGYPVRNVDEKAYLLPSVRNLAIAEKLGLDILVICNCCFASLQKAQNVMARDGALLSEFNLLLAKEQLNYSGKTNIKHFLTALYEDIGLEEIRKKLVYNYSELNISVLHGCHILRPREITRFDNSFVPKITEELLATTGATSLDWPGRLECCGAALAGINDEVAKKLLLDKIEGAKAAGATFITPVCSYCHLQCDTSQINLQGRIQNQQLLPVTLLPQLLGLCLGLEDKTLGIRENRTIESSDIDRLTSLLVPPLKEKKKKVKQKTTANS